MNSGYLCKKEIQDRKQSSENLTRLNLTEVEIYAENLTRLNLTEVELYDRWNY
jgi:hypothetical protein